MKTRKPQGLTVIDSPQALHSVLLALEPRQIFDGAVGAAIGEVLADDGPEAVHDQAGDPHQADQSQGANDQEAETQGADNDAQAPAYTPFGGIIPFSTNSLPIFSVDDNSTKIKSGEYFKLSNIDVVDYDGDLVSLTLTAQEGQFTRIDGTGTASRTLTFTGLTPDQLNAALAEYQFKLDGNDAGKPMIIYNLRDNHPGNDPVEGFFTVEVEKVNAPPQLTVNQGTGPNLFPESLSEKVTTTIRGITVSDIDKGDVLTLKIEAGGGKFTIGKYPGVTISGSGTGNLVLTGSAGAINSLLSTLNYSSDKAGSVTFDFTLTDKAGATVTESLVVEVNDPPSIVVGKDFTGVVEETSLNPGNQNPGDMKLGFGDITINDPNSGEILTVTLDINDTRPDKVGKLYYDGSVSGVEVTLAPDGQSLIIKGTRDKVNEVLDSVYYKGETNRYGDLSFTMKVTDSFNEEAQITKVISVTPVNDPPEVAPPTDWNDWLSVFEGQGGTLKPEHFGITDPDTPPEQVVITVAEIAKYGRLTKDGRILGNQSSFTLKEVMEGKIKYEAYPGQDVPTNGRLDTFKFTVDDGSNGLSGQSWDFKIRLNPVNNDFNVNTNSSEKPVNIGGKDHFPLWVWERQAGAQLGEGGSSTSGIDGRIRIYPGDDKPENILVTVGSVPPLGRLYLKENGTITELSAGSTFTADKLKFLCYDATDDEPEIANGGNGQTFSLTFTDRHDVPRDRDPSNPDTYFVVDDSQDAPKSKEYNFVIKYAPNNDDPILETNTGLGQRQDPHVIGCGTDGGDSRYVTITNDMLKVTDDDNDPDTITYTLKSVPDIGQLLYKMDNGQYRLLTVGSSFTQADIDSGKIVYEYLYNGNDTWPGTDLDGNTVPPDGHGHLSRDEHLNFSFTVRDGGVTSWLPGDHDPGTDHKGGIYDWGGASENPYTPGLGEGDLMVMDFDIYLRIYERRDGNPNPPVAPNQPPQVTVNNDKVPIISEAKASDDPHSPGPKYPSSFKLNTDIIFIKDDDTADKDLILSLLNSPNGGYLYVERNGVTERLFTGDTFTYAELKAGKVSYAHRGGECFQDTLRFVVSDGLNYVDTTTDLNSITVKIDILPYNDAPELSVNGEKLEVDEGGALILDGQWVNQNNNNQGGNGVFNFYDPDGYYSKDGYTHIPGYDPRYDNDSDFTGGKGTAATRPGDFSIDQMTFKVTELPDAQQGVLQVFRGGSWVAVDLNTEITRAEMENGHFRFLHNGSEPTDTGDIVKFKIKACDNSTEDGGKRYSKEVEVNLKVRAVNDAPEAKINQSITPAHVKEGESVVIGGKNAASGQPGLHFYDPDNTSDQVQYVIKESCKYGTLYRLEGDGSLTPLGRDSTFTQQELDSGKIRYQHNGKNHHVDSFKFDVTDGSKYAAGGPHVFNIAVEPVNQAPQFGGMHQLEVYYKDTSSPLKIIDDGADEENKYIKIVDPDAEDYIPGVTSLNDYMELTISALADPNNPSSGVGEGKLKITNLPDGVTIDGADTNRLILKGSLAAINEALKSLTFEAYNGGGDHDLNRTIHLRFDVNDCNNGGPGTPPGSPNTSGGDYTSGSGGALTATWSLAVHISTDNNAPTATVTDPGLKVPEETVTYLFTNGNAPNPNLIKLEFEDLDAFNTNTNTVTLSAKYGTLSFFDGQMPDGLVSVEENGNGLILTGTLDSLNEALKQIQYKGKTDFNGQDTITVIYDDHGNTGKDNGSTAQKWTGEFKIDVLGVNDRPTIGLNGFEADKQQIANGKLTNTLEINNNTPSAGGSRELDLGGKITIGDPKDFPGGGVTKDDPQLDPNTNQVTVTLDAKTLYGSKTPTGEFKVNGTHSNVNIDTSATGKIVLEGSWTDVQAALDALVYVVPEADCANNLVNIVVTVDDGGNGNSSDLALTNRPNNNTAQTNFLVNINITNLPPVIKGSDITINEDSYGHDPAKGINLAEYMRQVPAGSPLVVQDDDAFGQKVMYKIEVSGGTLWLNGQSKGQSISAYLDFSHPDWKTTGLSVADLNNLLSKLYFVPDIDFNSGTDGSNTITLTITVNDKGNTGESNDPTNGGLETVKSFKITVTPVNDAPEVEAGKKENLAPVLEDTPQADIPGDTVGNLFNKNGPMTDGHDWGYTGQGGTFSGVLITGNQAASQHGQWQYSTDNGATWTNVGTRSDGNALYLDTNAKLRFVPAADYNGTPGNLTARLVEQTTIATPDGNFPTLNSGTAYNLAATGGTYGDIDPLFRPYTANTVLLGTSITAVNDAPVITGSDVTIYEDLYGRSSTEQSQGVGLKSLMSGGQFKITDVDAGTGKLFYSIEVTGGSLWLNGQNMGRSLGDFTTGKTLTEINQILANVRFKPEADFNGQITLTVKANDRGNTGEIPGNLPSGTVEKNGGLETTKTFTITVKPVNDAPTSDVTEVTFPAVNEDTADPAGQTVEDLFAAHYGDAKDSQHSGQGGAFKGVFITGNGADASEGVWQYYNGSTWVDVPVTLGEALALYLDKDTQLRFKPAADFYGQPGGLTVRLVEDTPVNAPYGDPQLGGLTMPTLTGGASYDLSATGGDYGNIEAAFRPYSAPVALNTTVTAINDAPVLTAPPTFTVDEDGSLSLSGLSFADPDIRPAEGKNGAATYSFTISVGQGLLSAAPHSGVTITGQNTGSMTFKGTFADLNAFLAANKITYTPAADYYGPDTATITVNDGGNVGTGGPLSDTKTVAITVNPINDAPKINGGGLSSGAELPPIAAVDEGGTPTPVKTVDEIFSPHYNDAIDKKYNGAPPDVVAQHTFSGVLVTGNGADPSEGVWQYYDGSSWVDVPTGLSDSSGLYLDKTTQMRFKPSPNFIGEPGRLTVRLADGTATAARGDTVTSPAIGGTGPYSEGVLKITVTVNLVNQAPTWDPGAPGWFELPDQPEDFGQGGGTRVGALIPPNLFNDGGTRPDDQAGYLLDIPQSQGGQWQYSTDNGLTWITAQPGPDQALFLTDSDLIRFVSDQDWHGQVSPITVRLVDDSNNFYPLPTHSGLVDRPEAVGGDSRFSAESREIRLTVTPVNDAPEATQTEAMMNGIQGGQPGSGGAGQKIGEVVGSFFTDGRDRMDGQTGQSFQGVMVTGSAANPGQGFWQYSTDGQNWFDIDPAQIGPHSALYLDSEALIRFQPSLTFSGEPGKLTVRLVETEGPSTGPDVPLPPLVSGQGGHDLSDPSATGGISHIGGQDVFISINVAAPLPNHVTDTGQGNDGQGEWRPHEDKEKADPDNPDFERNGLDAPHLRHGSGLSGQSQEAWLITNNHLGASVNHGVQHFADSVNKSLGGVSYHQGGDIHWKPYDGDANLIENWLVPQDDDSPLRTLNRADFTSHLEGPARFKANMIDGTELPDWLEFDAETLSVKVLDHSRLNDEERVRIMAEDWNGHRVSMVLFLKPEEAIQEALAAEPQGAETDQGPLGPDTEAAPSGSGAPSGGASPSGSPDLDEQIQAQAPVSLLGRAREMLSGLGL